MRVYVESSAVLAWLLGEPIGDVVLKHLANAEAIFTSAITLLECERALIRARTVEEIAEEGLIDRRRVLTKASAHFPARGKKRKDRPLTRRLLACLRHCGVVAYTCQQRRCSWQVISEREHDE